jgi:CRISPR-associated protein Cas1
MAAMQTVPQDRQHCNFTPIMPQRGVVTLFGYGIKAHVDRGHLVLDDGIGPERRQARLPRIGHNLRRLVVIGSDGMVTLAALRWLADQDASFVMLNRDGSVLAATGPVPSSDSRLRRAQSLAHQSGAAVQISRGLISQKLQGQERIARHALQDSWLADKIRSFNSLLAAANTIDEIRQLESQAAQAYWSGWRSLPISFPTSDYYRVPEHWRTFGTRKSALTGSPRLAVNPPNAMLNYMYALLESESRLAAAAVGLDPCIGIMHADTDARDSLACDLMEPARPHVDTYLLNWITEGPLRREWFFEQRNGNCRLMGSFAKRLSESLSTWSRVVAPIAEWACSMLWSAARKPARLTVPPTHLTQAHRRAAKGKLSPPIPNPPRRVVLCRSCGKTVKLGSSYCESCAVAIGTAALVKGAQQARSASHSHEAQASRAEKGRRNTAARWAWQPSNQPTWITNESYRDRIRPGLAAVTVRVISSSLGVSTCYASNIRSGKVQPHPRHWETLAQLGGITDESTQVNDLSLKSCRISDAKNRCRPNHAGSVLVLR